MSIHRVACDCKCDSGTLGNCEEYTGCETVLKVRFSYPVYTATENFGDGRIFDAPATAFSGNVKIFTPTNCPTTSCEYQGVKTSDCLDEVKCIDPVAFKEPVPDAVSCWFGEKFENIGHYLIPEPQYPWADSTGDLADLSCDCWKQSGEHGVDGWYWSEIKQGGYLRYEDRFQQVWCQGVCAPDVCGAGDPDDPIHPDILGGACCDTLGYRTILYRGLVQRMVYSRLWFNKINTGCGVPYDSELPNNRWILSLGYTMTTSTVGRIRSCTGIWGTVMYESHACGLVGNPPSCTNCRENNRSNSWSQPAGSFTSFNGGEHCISSWSLPEGIVDCKDLVGINSSTTGVSLVKPYTPVDGTGGRWTGDRLLTDSYVQSGFEATSWTILDV